MRKNLKDVVVKYLFEEYLDSFDCIEDFVCDCNFSVFMCEDLELIKEEREWIKDNWREIVENVFRLGLGWENGDIDDIDEYLDL